MDGRRRMTAAELMEEYRDGRRRTAEAEARAMRREAMAYLALFAIGQVCAVAVAVVVPRLMGVHRWVSTRRGGVHRGVCTQRGGVHREVRTDGCAPGAGCVPAGAYRRWGIPTF